MFLAGCSVSESDNDATYAITVSNDGNGTGAAKVGGENADKAVEGATVTLTATPTGDYAFKQWTVVSGGVTLSSTTANPATFKMPAKAVEIKAEFEAVPWAEMTPTMTIAEFKALYQGQPTEIIDAGIVIGGRVNSTDRYGNFYRSLYIQDETGGMEVKLGKTGLHNIYEENQMLYIKPCYLWLGNYRGMISLGSKDPSGSYETSYIDVQSLIDKTVFRGSPATSDEEKITPIPIVSLRQLTADMQGKLVEIRNAYYQGLRSCSFKNEANVTVDVDTVTTWGLRAHPDNPVIAIPASYASHTFLVDGSTIVVRTSGYAEFAERRVENSAPKGTPVNITAIYTVDNNDNQLVLNSYLNVVRQ